MSIYDQVAQVCVEMQIPSTEFEIAFLMGSLFFNNEKCDAVVLEVCQNILCIVEYGLSK